MGLPWFTCRIWCFPGIQRSTGWYLTLLGILSSSSFAGVDPLEWWFPKNAFFLNRMELSCLMRKVASCHDSNFSGCYHFDCRRAELIQMLREFSLHRSSLNKHPFMSRVGDWTCFTLIMWYDRSNEKSLGRVVSLKIRISTQCGSDGLLCISFDLFEWLPREEI